MKNIPKCTNKDKEGLDSSWSGCGSGSFHKGASNSWFTQGSSSTRLQNQPPPFCSSRKSVSRCKRQVGIQATQFASWNYLPMFASNYLSSCISIVCRWLFGIISEKWTVSWFHPKRFVIFQKLLQVQRVPPPFLFFQKVKCLNAKSRCIEATQVA